MANVRVGPDYIQYWQGASAAQRGLTSHFGVQVKEGSFVGYGLELEGLHANLPYIARV